MLRRWLSPWHLRPPELFLCCVVSFCIFACSTLLLYVVLLPDGEVQQEEGSSTLVERIEDLRRIRDSVAAELAVLEARYHSLYDEINAQLLYLNELRSTIDGTGQRLQQLRAAVGAAEMQLQEATAHSSLILRAPLRLAASDPTEDMLHKRVHAVDCTFDACWNFARCPLSRPFKFFLVESATSSPFYKALSISVYRSVVEETACAFFLVANHASDLQALSDKQQNYVVFVPDHLANLALSKVPRSVFVIQSSTSNNSLRRAGYDVLLPPLIDEDGPFWQTLPPIIPARRKRLLTFSQKQEQEVVPRPTQQLFRAQLTKLAAEWSKSSGEEGEVVFRFDCNVVDEGVGALCSSESNRRELIDSTFVLIPSPELQFSQAETLMRVQQAIKFGAIPVLIGEFHLPLKHLINWDQCVIRLSLSRLPEVMLVVGSIPDDQILEQRRQCRQICEHSTGTAAGQANAVIDFLLSSLRMPASTPFEVDLPYLYHDNALPVVSMPDAPQMDEYLGIVELPYTSPAFQHNFSHCDGYSAGHYTPTSSRLYPQDPFRLPLPTEAQFSGSSSGFRPINRGAGGSGRVFADSLGGNFPREQFTVVMLTYDRDAVLVDSLKRLNNLPYLNKIIVIWNNDREPPISLQFPLLTAPLHVLRAPRNSLNNRFLPLSLIETEAILSLDDDVYLRHDEIVFAFRVWRENRHRLVGFPARFHAWNASAWRYDSNHTCQYSMILTGAAFFHRYYTYLYSHDMPVAIREKVDELMNCEDIAMNFLVSHTTRQPPVKATSRWTFRCPGCTENLWEDESHFTERHDCINFFSRVYGYNPLLYSQHRVDSVLFKTRLPMNHQKCFKYV